YGAAKLIKREGQEPLIQRTIIDITDAHNQSKSETESLLQAYQAAIGATGDVVFVYDFENDTSVLTSTSALRLQINPLVSGVPYDIIKHGAIAPESIDAFVQAHEEIKKGAKNSAAQVKLCGFYGLNGYFKLTFQTLFDKEGNPTKKAVGIFHDITNVVAHDLEQLKIIQTLGDSFASIYYIDLASKKYKRIKENETSALIFPDEGLWEEGFAKYVEAFAGKEYHHYFKEMIKLDDLSRLMEKNEKIVIEYQRKDNDWRRAFLLRSEITAEGKLKSAVFAVQNIQEDKKKELDTQKALREAYSAAQMASAAKTTFLSNMSHDIRTPLNAIIGMTAVAGANLEDPKKISDCLKKITSSGKHLLGLINQILDMSNIESGKIDLNEIE
ncbi:MAG: hypothetical protein HUJ63_09690, partial [Enterococcus sp.]|nr:hypothetical protein [Enterococcus sp.]